MPKADKDQLSLSGLVDQKELQNWLDQAEEKMRKLKQEVSIHRKYLNQLKALKDNDYGTPETDPNEEKQKDVHQERKANKR